ncbi:uncharacterized protein BDW70DRAFT_155554 [Aspergillus foveolatus]|uniref:uncharacterized protein n=1 Tax=Aspergillus foveolatus TaxID=210207 RepID=UPI003CCDF66B
MQVLVTLISIVALLAVAATVPANEAFSAGSGCDSHDGCSISRNTQTVGTQPFPPGSGGDYHDDPLLNVHGPTVPIHHGKGPIPRDAQTASSQPFPLGFGGGYRDEPESHVAARGAEGHEPYLNVHDPTIPIHPEDVVVTDNLTPRDIEGKEFDTSEFDGPCRVNRDCNAGSFCIANWCTAARELDDGTLVLPHRDIVGEDENYWYYKSRIAIKVLDELTGKVDAKNIGNACPKQCDGKGGNKRCCPRHFCQPPRCLGDPDDFKDHD